MTHTPAPWKVNGHKVKAGSFEFFQGCAVGAPADEWKANAALIAAAPELLEAAQYVIALLASDFPNGNIALDKCRAAIAKAGGAA